MPVVDACVWISAMLEDEHNHKKSIDFFKLIASKGEKIVIPTLAITEVGASLLRRTGDFEFAKEAVQTLQHPNIHIEPITNEIASLAFRLCQKAPLRGADAIYVAVAQKTGEALVSLDKELVERGAQIVTTIGL